MSEKPFFEKPPFRTPEQLQLRRKVFKELRKFADNPPPEPDKEWDLIWVLSGPAMDIRARFDGQDGQILFPEGDRETETVKK